MLPRWVSGPNAFFSTDILHLRRREVHGTYVSSASLSGGSKAQRRLVLRMQVTAMAGSGVVLIAVVLIDPMEQ